MHWCTVRVAVRVAAKLGVTECKRGCSSVDKPAQTPPPTDEPTLGAKTFSKGGGE
jgi:hypothetical protein